MFFSFKCHCTRVEALEEYVLRGCTSLNQISLPPTLQKIHECSLMGCTSLPSITIPYYGVTVIGSEAFTGCSNLSSITLPDTLCGMESNRDGVASIFKGTRLLKVKILCASEEGFLKVMKIIQPHLDESSPGAEIIKEV